MRVAGRASVRLRRVTQFVVGLALTASALTLAVPSASAATCAYDTLGRSLAVTAAPGEVSLRLRATGAYLDVNDVYCALLADVNTVTVHAAASPNVHIYFDLVNGPLGPGYANEGNGSSEIEFTVNGLSPTSWVHVDGSAGNDKVTIGHLSNRVTGYSAGVINLNAYTDGGTPDNDVVFPASPGHIVVDGSFGDDVISGQGTGTFSTNATGVPLDLTGRWGSNDVTGGNGSDIIRYEQSFDPEGPDVLTGGLGVDTVAPTNTGKNSERTTASITLDGVANDGTNCPGTGCNGDNVAADFEVVQGSSASEAITGNASAQTLLGGTAPGTDQVKAGGGADTLVCQGAGTYNGGAGNDSITVLTHCGTVIGSTGVDTASFQNYPLPPVVVTLDNIANDGELGNNINVRTDIENLVGTVLGDTLSGSRGPNTIDGGAGNDILYGQDGADTLIPGPGEDTVYGGPGIDRLSYATSLFAIVVDAVARTVTGQGDDTYTSIQSYLGSPLGDVMDGSGANERFIGSPGNDDIFGAGGNDVLLGGEGDDTLNGGTGTDTCTQGAGTGPVVDCEA